MQIYNPPESGEQWIVFLDAVGTIIRPRNSVIDTYHEHGIRFGSQLTRDEIDSRFWKARQTVFASGDRLESLPSSDDIEKQLWFDLVSKVFGEVPNIEELFQELWTFYSIPRHWEIFPDVANCVEKLQEMHVKIGLASNFDSRLSAIAMSFAELGKLDWVYYSSHVGFRKPDPRFYKSIEASIAEATSSNEAPRFLMVGDHPVNDVAAPQKIGWLAIHLDREADKTNDDAISSLADLPDRFAEIADSSD